MLAVISVVFLYMETSLQLFVVVTSHALPVPEVPVALATIALTFLAFLITTITSIALTLQLTTFRKKLRSKLIFSALHACGTGLLWRAFKLVLIFSESDLKHLNYLRMVHVGLQSSPYVTLYIRFFVVGSKINAIQALSLVVSIVSSSLALTAFNLGKHFTSYTNKEQPTVENSFFRQCSLLVATTVGTTFVYGVRLISIALMASQQGFWVFLPLALHFLVMVSMYGFQLFKEGNLRYKTLCSQVLHSAGMAWLNVLDFVQDSIPSMKCRYVGFGSLYLVENIIMLSFWLLDSNLSSMSKLFMITGILTIFIIGLIAKFLAYDSLNDKHTKSGSDDSGSAPYRQICTNIATLPHSTRDSQSEVGRGHSNYDNMDDLISIIQTAVQARSQSNISGVLFRNGTSECETCRIHSPRVHQSQDEKLFHSDICSISGSCSETQEFSQSQCSQSRHKIHTLKPFYSHYSLIFNDKDNSDTLLSSHYLHNREKSLVYQRNNHSEETSMRQASEILLDPSNINHPEWEADGGASQLCQNPTFKLKHCSCNGDSKDELRVAHPHPHRIRDCFEPRSQRTRFQYSSDFGLSPCTFEMTQFSNSPSISLSKEMTYSEITQSSLPETQTETDDGGDSRTSSTFTSSSTTTIQTNR